MPHDREQTTIPCTSPWEPCSSHDECEGAGLCLGSDEGVAYQERTMKAFFDALFTEYANHGVR